MIKGQPLILKNMQLRQAGAGGWQIVYTGFILIMLCFFIMLTSFASLEHSKITRFANSFTDAVSVFSGGTSLESSETIINADATVVNKADRIASLFEKVKVLGQQQGLKQISLRRSQRNVIMTLADNALFESGDAALSKSSYALLNKISSMINQLDVLVDIEGHTDDKPIRTDAYPSNWDLSTARAVNVLRYLTSEGKVESARLSAVGLSKYHPMVPNSTFENRAKNRRVEIIFRAQRL
jgi:chemotaxis protein MotB